METEREDNEQEGNNERTTIQSTHQEFSIRIILYVIAMVCSAVANSVLFKKMLNMYKSRGVSDQHNYEFFVNQLTTLLYVILAVGIVIYKRLLPNGKHWYKRQPFPLKPFMVMGFLDAFSGLLVTIGGANTGGGLQSLLNQSIIPITMVLSQCFLSSKYSCQQQTGAYIILIGTAVAVWPTLIGGNHQTTTPVGVTIFFSGIFPTALSNVYKEWAFKSEKNTDIYFLTTWVSFIQVILGFIFLPILALPGFGGLPFSEIPNQLKYGTKCFLNINSLPGDHCDGALQITLYYVFANFWMNVLQLLLCKHGSATLMVIAAALALPITNIAFTFKFLMGPDTETFFPSTIVALIVIVIGFVMYSQVVGKKTKHAPSLPIQVAGGSMIYMRERTNSDPSTPGYTPIRLRTPRITPRQLATSHLGPASSPMNIKNGSPKKL